MPGAAVEQDDVILNNMTYAVRTWQIDRKGPKEHTAEDKEFMRTVVQPKRGG